MLYALSLLIVITIASLIHAIRLKLDIRHIKNDFVMVNEKETNALLTTETFDSDISQLIMGINDMLQKSKKTQVESNQINQELKQAITNISHDVRTPLTASLGYLQMLESNNDLSDSKRDEYQMIIHQRLKDLSLLLNDLLEYSRLQEMCEDKQLEKININNILMDVISGYYDQLIEGDFQVIIDIDDKVISCMANRRHIERIFTNLINNTLKHGENYCEINLDAKLKCVSIKNQLVPSDTLNIESIFQRFYTSDISRSNKSAGLGLAIVKQLVDKIDATITADVVENYLIITIYFNNSLY